MPPRSSAAPALTSSSSTRSTHRSTARHPTLRCLRHAPLASPALVARAGPGGDPFGARLRATAGVLIPHVSSADYAREVAALCRYRGGKRGFATSTRAGRYTAVPMWRHIADPDANTVVVAQIEDP